MEYSWTVFLSYLLDDYYSSFLFRLYESLQLIFIELKQTNWIIIISNGMNCFQCSWDLLKKLTKVFSFRKVRCTLSLSFICISVLNSKLMTERTESDKLDGIEKLKFIFSMIRQNIWASTSRRKDSKVVKIEQKPSPFRVSVEMRNKNSNDFDSIVQWKRCDVRDRIGEKTVYNNNETFNVSMNDVLIFIWKNSTFQLLFKTHEMVV